MDMCLKIKHAPRRGDTFVVSIDAINAKGFGVGRIKTAVGPQEALREYRASVRYAVPGDVVQVGVIRRKRDDVECHLEQVIVPSNERISPRCIHFGPNENRRRGCGGCSLQYFDYPSQLKAKTERVAAALSSIGVEAASIAPIKGMDDPWYYRNKMEFSFGLDEADHLTLGLHPGGYRYEVMALDSCVLQSVGSNRLVSQLGKWFLEKGVEVYSSRKGTGFLKTLTVREGKRTGERMIELMTSTANETTFEGELVSSEKVADRFQAVLREFSEGLNEEVTSIYWTKEHVQRGTPTTRKATCLWGNSLLAETLNLPGEKSVRFEIHPHAFFQTNSLQAEVLYSEVLLLSGLLENQGGRVLDLYCGTGTISMVLAPYADHVKGIELNEEAVENARRNAQINGFDHVTFTVGDVGKVLNDTASEEKKIDLVVVDPPRSGLQGKSLPLVSQLDCPRLIYVSCNPDTLSRDLKTLIGEGWVVENVCPVDMFPHTGHVEVVTHLQR
jgi:23S rRNA (uracil1939-C5)-methyltransferase